MENITNPELTNKQKIDILMGLIESKTDKKSATIISTFVKSVGEVISTFDTEQLKPLIKDQDDNRSLFHAEILFNSFLSEYKTLLNVQEIQVSQEDDALLRETGKTIATIALKYTNKIKELKNISEESADFQPEDNPCAEPEPEPEPESFPEE